MTAPALCAAPIQGTLMRIARLDACGAPVAGAGGQVVTDGFVQVAVTQTYEDGTEYQKRNAHGVFCVNETGNDQFRRVDLDIEFCAIDPDVVNLITGVSVVVTGAPSTGTGFWVQEGDVTQRFSLEVWQAVSGQACGTGGLPRYVYWAFPNLGAGRFNDFTIQDDTLEWKLSAKSKIASPNWGAGPTANDWISAVPANAHYGFNIAALPLPAVTGCGAVTL